MYIHHLLAVFENLTPLNTDNMLKALEILWQGLLAIFIAIAVIILAVTLIRICIVKAEGFRQKRLAEKQDPPTDRDDGSR